MCWIGFLMRQPHPQGDQLPRARDVYLEYVTDVEVFTRAHIFVGSHSNVYALVAALRMTLFPISAVHFGAWR